MSNTLSGGSNQPAPAQSGSATATIGVRGMDEDEKAAAAQNADSGVSLKSVDTWAATKIEAETAAKKRGLKANSAVTLSAAVAAGEAQ